MNLPIKKLGLVFLFAIVLALIYSGISNIPSSTELSNRESALTFLKDVAGLDMTKYSTELMWYENNGVDASGISTARAKFILTSNESKMDVICIFRNNILVWSKLYPIEGKPIFAEPATNVVDDAKSLVERYQTFAKATYLQPMRTMLDAVTELKPTKIVKGGVQLEMSIEDNLTRVEWIETVDGLEIRQNTVSLHFLNGTFSSFANSWGLYKVGTTEIRVPREEAIRMAREQALDYSYRHFADEDVGDYSVLEEPAFIELNLANRGNYTVYPSWNIYLVTDKPYARVITCFHVGIWADTGLTMGFVALGGPPSETMASSPEP